MVTKDSPLVTKDTLYAVAATVYIQCMEATPMTYCQQCQSTRCYHINPSNYLGSPANVAATQATCDRMTNETKASRAVNACNSRLLFLMSEARQGRREWQVVETKQIIVLRDWLRFADVRY